MFRQGFTETDDREKLTAKELSEMQPTEAIPETPEGRIDALKSELGQLAKGLRNNNESESDRVHPNDANTGRIEDKAEDVSPQIASLKKRLEKLLSDADTEGLAPRGEGLSEGEKERVKEETGWSDEIVDALGSIEEYEIYKKAGLVEAEIAGKKCLIRTDIDWDQEYVDPFTNETKTNRDRVKDGLAPLDKNGRPIQLHHIGQHADSPLAELTFEEHRCGGNDTILHDKTKPT